MDFGDSIRHFANGISETKRCCKTEEGTKHSLILPVIQMLGYNIFDPTEVVPEVDCDIRGTGDKVDYVIQQRGQHLILIECKHWTKDLDYYVSQLRGYFVGSKAHFGVLTNGVEWRFYTDLDNTNLMDEKPFLIVDIERLTEDGLDGLKMFYKEAFNEQFIMEKADELKCTNLLRDEVRQEFSDPSFELVTHFARRIYGQVPSRAARERMKPLLAKVFGEIMATNSDKQTLVEQSTSDMPDILSVVQDILKDIVSPERIKLFVGTGYSSIRLDGSQWWPIIKFKYTDFSKWVALGKYWPETYHFYCDHNKERITIGSIDDVRNFSDDIRDIVQVMLIGGDDCDERRAAWVNEHRTDWC